METQNQNYYGNDNLELEDAVEGNLYRDTAVDNREILAVPAAQEIEGGASGDDRIGNAGINSVLNDIDNGPDDDDDLDDEDLDDDLIDDDLVDDDDPEEPFDIDDDLSIVDEDLDDDDLDDDDDF